VSPVTNSRIHEALWNLPTPLDYESTVESGRFTHLWSIISPQQIYLLEFSFGGILPTNFLQDGGKMIYMGGFYDSIDIILVYPI
jgi:hypothetical protein